MSSIYIQEPATNGKVLLVTSVGDIDIELWPKEAPKACRNFVQLCLEGYYDGTIFHRIVKGFIAQGGDPTGTGVGGESIYGEPFKDEIHQRLQFTHRGIVAMANAGPNDNGSQFFFTFDATPELKGKHTIFGKVIGNTIYNMLKLQETLVGKDDKPIYDQVIHSTKVLSNPFDDLVPRGKKSQSKAKTSKASVVKGAKNFSLLSFGEEAEEDEEEVNELSIVMRNKSKSSHDLIDDPSLSAVPAVDVSNDKRKYMSGDEDKEEEDLHVVRKKFEKNKDVREENNSLKSPEMDEPQEIDKATKRLRERDAIRAEVKKLKREMKVSERAPKQETKREASDSDKVSDDENEMTRVVKQQRKKFKNIKKTQLKKGSAREQNTLAILSKFQSKLQNIRQTDETNKSDSDEDSWLNHELRFEDQGPVVAKDANMKNADSFGIFDPRNPMNQRRREKKK